MRAQRSRDLLRDVVVELDSRRLRTLLLTVAIALSTGALGGSMGISSTARMQVDANLAAATVNLVDVESSRPQEIQAGGPLFGPEAVAQAEKLDGVEFAGLRIDVSGLVPVAIERDHVAAEASTRGLVLAGLTSGYLAALRVRATPDSSWQLDATQGDTENVAFLGRHAAEVLRVPIVSNPIGYSILVGGVPHSIGGFLSDGDVDLSDVVALPYSSAVVLVGGDNDARMVVKTLPGAGAPIARVIRLALRPDNPASLAASQVVDTSVLRRGVSTQLDRLAAWAGALLLVLTVCMIANAMIVAVIARTGEIGLRRAMGAPRRSVAALFLAEGGVTGVLGGLGGTAITLVAIVVVAAANTWTPVVGSWSVAAPIVMGCAVGVVSSLYPAIQAARIEPALAVRFE